MVVCLEMGMRCGKLIDILGAGAMMDAECLCIRLGDMPLQTC